jgi:hypothetical protein
MEAPQNLGPLEPWQIRGFPRFLRQRIITQAKLERMSPGEFVTRIMLAYEENGWLGQAPPVSTDVARPERPSADDTHLLIELADRRPGLRPTEQHLVHKAIKHRLRLMLSSEAPVNQIANEQTSKAESEEVVEPETRSVPRRRKATKLKPRAAPKLQKVVKPKRRRRKSDAVLESRAP